VGVTQAIPGGVYVRKAPCQFGWDWGPMLPPIGIWKDIAWKASVWPALKIFHLRQFHSEKKVTVEAGLASNAWKTKRWRSYGHYCPSRR